MVTKIKNVACFVTSANQKVGFGNLARCLVLAEKLKGNFKIVFIIPKEDGGIERITSAGYAIYHAAVDNVVQTLSKINPLIIVADIPYKHIFRSKINQFTNATKLLVVVDDTNRGKFNCNLLLNHNINAKKNNYICSGKLLLGTKYYLIRSAFITNRKKIKVNANHILLTFGASDPHGFSEIALDAVSNIKGIVVRLVIGPGFSENTKLGLKQKSERLGPRIKLVEGETNLLKHMLWADVAVCSLGISSYELAATGTPFIILCHDATELGIARSLEDAGAAINMGVGTQVTADKLAEEIVRLLPKKGERESMSHAAMGLVDGKGADRVREEIIKMVRSLPP